MAADLNPAAIAEDKPPVHPQPPAQARRRTLLSWPTAAVAVAVAVADVVALAGIRLPFLGPAVGFSFLLILPVYLLCTTSLWQSPSVADRLAYSISAVLLALMLTGLVANTLLPLIGVPRPLDPVPVAVIGDIVVVSAYVLRWRFPAERARPGEPAWQWLRTLNPHETRLLIAAALCVPLAVFGANRLNNNAGDQVSLAALAVSVVALLVLLGWHKQIGQAVTYVAIYLVSLGLLLQNSLRGWFVTGHDIQTEYQVFQLALAHGHWDISSFHNAYNACLSITILPTEIAQIVHVNGPYIYKVFFQIIFAACPVLVYAIARRYFSVPVAILASIYFIGFPTFFTDMPFLNRQEPAFIFVCAGVLAITNTAWSPRRRRLTLLVAAVGVELSHYSTMYLLAGTLFTAWVALQAVKLLDRRRRPSASHAKVVSWSPDRQILNAGAVLSLFAIAFVWGYLITQTAGAVLTDAESAISGLIGKSAGARSENVDYSLLFWRKPSSQAVLNEYRAKAEQLRRTVPPSAYLPSGDQAGYPLRAVNEPLLPLTAAGRALHDIGIPVAGLNTTVRLMAAEGEQVFIGVGLIAFLMVPRLKRQISREFFWLCASSASMLVVVTILPGLSVDYGVLRVFQGALILIGPILVAGSLEAFRFLGTTWGPRIAAGICLGIFISTTGLLPQVLGGYPAQLGLNNSGQDYDSYYVHPQEVAAVRWLAHEPGSLPAGVQASFSPYRFLFTQPSDVTSRQYIGDAFPPLVRPSTWVILDYSIVHFDRAALSYSGDLIFYAYPQRFLWNNKSLVYNNGGAEIYR